MILHCFPTAEFEMLTSVMEETNGSPAGERVPDSFTSVRSVGTCVILAVMMLTRPGAAQSQENERSSTNSNGI